MGADCLVFYGTYLNDGITVGREVEDFSETAARFDTAEQCGGEVVDGGEPNARQG